MTDFPYIDGLPTLETKRLHLVFPTSPVYVDAIQEAIDESREHLKPWMHWWAYEKEAIAQRVPMVIEQVANREDYPMYIVRKADNRYLGSTGCHPRDKHVPSVEIGYWLRVSATGQGYATEAAQGVLRFAFEHLGANRAMLTCDLRNTTSAPLARRLGFRQEGPLRHHMRTHHGDLRDTLVFGLLREEWEGANEAAR